MTYSTNYATPDTLAKLTCDQVSSNSTRPRISAPHRIPNKYGLFEYLVLPFGLTNAPATFMTLMNDVFRECLDKFTMVYLDDILIYSSTYKEHIDHIRQALSLLRENSLFAKMSKCEFAKNSVEYLGHVISDHGFSMEEDKINSIQNWHRPACKRDVQSFLGLVNFYPLRGKIIRLYAKYE